MSLHDILRKIPEAVQVMPLTREYRNERLRLLEEIRVSNPELVKNSGLESTSPFEYTAFLSSLLHIAKEIGPKILDYHLISDDRSGRIPTLVFMNWQRRVEEANGIDTPYTSDNPRVDFILGGWRNYNSQKIDEFIRQNQERLRAHPQLLVTDTIDEGSTMLKLFPLFEKYGIRPDVAILSHYDPVASYKNLFAGRKVYHGEILPSRFQEVSAGSTVIRRNKLGGIADPPENDKKYHPIRVQDPQRGMEVLVREQAKNFAQKLPIPKKVT